jgi:heptosyltransferase-3
MKKDPKSVLVVVTRELGDLLLSTPLIRSIRYAWPNATLDVLVFQGREEMLESNLDVDNIISVPVSPKIGEFIKICFSLFKKYDLSVITQGSDRAHLYGFFSGRYRVGMLPEKNLKNLWKAVLCRRFTVLDDKDTHTVIQNLLLAKRLGITEIPIVSPPSEPLSTDIEDNINNISSPGCTFHVGTRCTYKEWPIEYWKELARHILDSGYAIYLTGKGSKDEAICSEIMSEFPDMKLISLANKLRLSQITSLLHRSEFYVGPDTSVTHLAASMGIPTVALYGPTNPVKWGPWPGALNGKLINPYKRYASPWQHVGNVILLQGRRTCVPCHLEGCDRWIGSTSECLREITPTDVIRAINEIVKQHIRN